MKRALGFRVAAVALAVLALVSASGRARAEEYVLGPEDVIAISVYLHPELERAAVINADGEITFPPVGSIKAAGLTPRQLGERIADKLSTYLRQTTSVTVSVTQYLSQSVFVSGAVAHPGRFGFERIPGLIDVISQAGGVVPGADLSRVEILRREGDGRKTLYADVASALRDGVGVPLPELKPGDAIVVPAATTLGGVGTAGEGVGVLGEVLKPGLYSVGTGQDLWTVLATAGGITPRADLSNVRIVTAAGETQAVMSVDLRETLRRGSHGPYVVKGGDVVVVMATGSSQVARGWTGFQALLTTSVSILNLAVLAQVLANGSATR